MVILNLNPSRPPSFTPTLWAWPQGHWTLKTSSVDDLNQIEGKTYKSRIGPDNRQCEAHRQEKDNRFD